MATAGKTKTREPDIPYLHARRITKRFGDVSAVDDVTISIETGETLVLLGPSGCGKTTLLRILAGLEVPDSGTIVLDGETLTSSTHFVPAERRRIGMVFQDWALFPHLTVAGNVAFGLEKSEIDQGRVAETLEMVGLTQLADRYPDALSGGQMQRVALARALAPRPRVLLFDEPFSNLDTTLRAQVRSDIALLMREVGMTSIFVTHDQEEAFVLGDRVAVMKEGRVLQVGTPADVYQYPATPWVASFVGEANLVEGQASEGIVSTPVGAIALANEVQGRCRVVLRPEFLMIGNGYDGLVNLVEFYGHDTSYEVTLNGDKLLVRGLATPRFRPGDRVSVTYSGPRVVAFPVDAPEE